MPKHTQVFAFTVFLFLLPNAFAAKPSHSADQAEHASSERQAGEANRMEALELLGILETREGSGTSWLPDETPMYAFHTMVEQWRLMFHGNLFLQYIDEGSRRGDDQFGSINWVMAMAKRPLGGGELGLRAMLSAEPWTVGKCGYPDLLATGEFCNGEPIHDRQHPHDLFMELAGLYRRELSSRLGIEIYGGPSAEPALGPTAFPHRPSALYDPLAPITHHWFDSTHISFGVFTAGVFSQQWKVEGSVFNGREPDEDRTDLDLAPMDSFSGRFSFLPSRNWSFQMSAGHLEEAEQGEEVGDPRVDVDRYTASAIYHRRLSQGGIWATTLGFARNTEEGQGSNAVLIESSYNIADRHIVSGRIEWVEKTGHDLALEDAEEERIFPVVKLAGAYTYQFNPISGLIPGIGSGILVSSVPESLEGTYGERLPIGFAVYLSLRPAQMDKMEMNHSSH